MRIINFDNIKTQLNRCYVSYDPDWLRNVGKENIMNAFKYHLEDQAGLKVDFEVVVDKSNRMGYKMNCIEVVDDEAFMLWMLTWT